jgi:6-phosphogluconolactonase/glucosamine-6-phosphate isomerase/deaminase
MQFVKTTSTDTVADYLAGVITEQLTAGKKVLWLVPGGSAIAVAIAVSKRLHNTSLANLTMTLTDERYGPVGHTDSNWQQLKTAGFWLQDARMQPVLIDKDLDTTVKNFAQMLTEDMAVNDYCIGLFGMGPDGHTAGILPHSEAVDDEEFAHGYMAGEFERITMTPVAISQLNEAVLYVQGEAKWPMVDQLATDALFSEQPAQGLKRVAKLTIFNDHKGD